jgi:hypothetical protein
MHAARMAPHAPRMCSLTPRMRPPPQVDRLQQDNERLRAACSAYAAGGAPAAPIDELLRPPPDLPAEATEVITKIRLTDDKVGLGGLVDGSGWRACLVGLVVLLRADWAADDAASSRAPPSHYKAERPAPSAESSARRRVLGPPRRPRARTPACRPIAGRRRGRSRALEFRQVRACRVVACRGSCCLPTHQPTPPPNKLRHPTPRSTCAPPFPTHTTPPQTQTPPTTAPRG